MGVSYDRSQMNGEEHQLVICRPHEVAINVVLFFEHLVDAKIIFPNRFIHLIVYRQVEIKCATIRVVS